LSFYRLSLLDFEFEIKFEFKFLTHLLNEIKQKNKGNFVALSLEIVMQ